MKKLKIKLFFLKYKLIINLVIIIIICLVSTKIISSISITNNPNTIGLVGTLLGAIVGGVFSLVGSIYVNNQKIISESEIKRKNIIYKPLYDELLENRRIMEKNPYPSYVLFERRTETMVFHQQISAWNRICSDSRILEIPSILKKQYEKYLDSINAYLEIIKDINEIINSVVKDTLKKKTKECEISGIGISLFQDILENRQNSKSLKDNCFMLPQNKKEISDEIWNEIQIEVFDICNQKEEIKNIRKLYSNWLKMQNDTIKLLELLILKINIKYEKQRK